MQALFFIGQHFHRQSLGLVDEAADLLIYQLGGGIGDILAARYGMAEEDLFLVVLVTQRSELFRHAPFGDHFARHAGGLLNIVTGPGGDALRSVYERFRHPATEHHCELGLEFLDRVAVTVALGQVHGQAKCSTTRDYRDLMQRIIAFDEQADQRVACFVIGG